MVPSCAAHSLGAVRDGATWKVLHPPLLTWYREPKQGKKEGTQNSSQMVEQKVIKEGHHHVAWSGNSPKLAWLSGHRPASASAGRGMHGNSPSSFPAAEMDVLAFAVDLAHSQPISPAQNQSQGPPGQPAPERTMHI